MMGLPSSLLQSGVVLLLSTQTLCAPSWPDLKELTYRQSCKCTPQERCWPKQREWDSFNKTVSGHLIKSVPVAQACYPGPAQNAEQCAKVDAGLIDSDFVGANSIALSYPISIGCAAVNTSAGETPVGKCELGDVPLYTVDARSAEEVSEGVKFAKQNNLRLVVRNTGHDILGRSTGYGSFQVWLHNLRDGIKYQKRYEPSDKCRRSSWKGSSFKVGGGYVWGDIYPEAAKNKVVAVGGGDPSVGIFGGWMQGGGHSPASRDFGLGADQLLEATVVTADGKIVTASACSNPDLFFALRGGGPGSYGIITSATIKAHPSPKVVAQTLAIAPLSPEHTDAFMEAVAIVYESCPSLFKAGYSGYGSWGLSSPAPLFANFTTAFVHAMAVFDKTENDVKKAFEPVAKRLAGFNNTKLVVNTQYTTFPSYDAYYNKLSGAQSPVGTSSALASRLLDTRSLTRDPKALRKALKTMVGKPEESTSVNMCVVAPANDAGKDPWSGILPTWRGAVVHNIVARGWAPGSDQMTIDAVHRDITFNKNMAQVKLAPNMGSYMNEGDRLDPDYKRNFYGGNLGKLERVKRRWDPEGVFYCPTCVGSDRFFEDVRGAVCSRR